MAATQVERIVSTTYDGKKVVVVNVANPVFVSGGTIDITVNSMSEVNEVFGPSFGFVTVVSGQITATSGNLMATAQASGWTFEVHCKQESAYDIGSFVFEEWYSCCGFPGYINFECDRGMDFGIGRSALRHGYEFPGYRDLKSKPFFSRLTQLTHICQMW